MTVEELRDMMKAGNRKHFGAENAIDIPGQPKTWQHKAQTAIVCQDLSLAMDCVAMCGWSGSPPLYSRYTEDRLGDSAQGAQMFSAVTGIETTPEEMLRAMDVIFNIERCILVREGRRRKDDIYPDEMYKSDSWKWTSKQEFEKALADYYLARGWNPADGIPRRSTLEKLGLKQIADELEAKYGVRLAE
jgi:aldehyde:ferredoxin oxidoreductase